MAYQDLREFIRALEKNNELKRIPFEVDPRLEITEFADRAVKQGGPALLFERPTGYNVPVLVNAFASMRKMEIALEVESVEEVAQRIVEFLEMRMPEGIIGKLKMLPKLAEMGAFFPKIVSKGPCQEVVRTDGFSLLDYPVLQCWPDDGGRFITLPLVFSRNPDTGQAQLRHVPHAGVRRAHGRACTGRPTSRARNTIAGCSSTGASAWTWRWRSAPTRPRCTRRFCRCRRTSTR